LARDRGRKCKCTNIKIAAAGIGGLSLGVSLSSTGTVPGVLHAEGAALYYEVAVSLQSSGLGERMAAFSSNRI
jgi:hypothetical protein